MWAGIWHRVTCQDGEGMGGGVWGVGVEWQDWVVVGGIPSFHVLVHAFSYEDTQLLYRHITKKTRNT